MTTNQYTQYKRFERALEVKAQSYSTLCAITGWSRPTVKRHIDNLRESGEVFVEDYGLDSRGRKIVPLFKAGKGQDAERPGPARTPAECMRDYRARKKAEEARLRRLVRQAGLA